jgi:hypothetical protein
MMEEEVKKETASPKPVIKRRGRKPAPKRAKAESKVRDTEPTAPVVKKHDVTEPWKRSSTLRAPKISGYTVRWMNTRKEGREDQVTDEGWQYVYKKEVPGFSNTTITDGSSVDGKIRRRELVLMKLPLDRKVARDKYISDRTMTPEKMAIKLENDMTAASGERGHSIFKVANES